MCFLGQLFHLVVRRYQEEIALQLEKTSHEPLAFQSKDRASVLPTSPLAGQLINRAPFFWSGGGEHRENREPEFWKATFCHWCWVVTFTC